MARPYREVAKPFSIRTLELVQALQLIADSVQSIRQGRIRHLVTLSGQLRALLAEKSKGAKPLLLDVARELNEDLRVFCMPGVDDPGFPLALQKDLVLHVAGFPITSKRQFAAQIETTFPQLLEHKILLINGNSYTTKMVVEWYANKAGGAHYATRLPEDFAALLLQNPFNLKPLVHILTQLGDAVLLAGQQLLQKLVNLEIHMIVVLPSQPPEAVTDANYLLDSQYEGSPMRLSIVLNKRLMPSFLVCGLGGSCARVDSDRIIDWSVPRHLNASLRIEPDLSSVLELAVDGVRVGRLRVEEPLFVLSESLDYETFQNKAVGAPPQEFSFAIAHISMYRSELNPIDAARMFAYIHGKLEEKDLSVILYLPRSFGHAARGTKDLHMTGTVRKTKVSNVLKH